MARNWSMRQWHNSNMKYENAQHRKIRFHAIPYSANTNNNSNSNNTSEYPIHNKSILLKIASKPLKLIHRIRIEWKMSTKIITQTTHSNKVTRDRSYYFFSLLALLFFFRLKFVCFFFFAFWVCVFFFINFILLHFVWLCD